MSSRKVRWLNKSPSNKLSAIDFDILLVETFTKIYVYIENIQKAQFN